VRGPLRFLLPVTLLVAAPLLGVGGRAQAGYLAPVSVAERPHADSFLDGAPQADSDDMGPAASTNGDFAPDFRSDDNDGQALLTPPAAPTLAPFGASSGDAGSPAPSDGAGAQNTGQPPALTAQPPTDAPALVGALFLQTVLRRPPPFPSRLFRPPRLS
jgi:hypothetical protein